MVSIHVDFEGGLQTDFNAPNGLDVTVGSGMTVGELPKFLVEKYIGDYQKIRFINKDGEVLPGVLVMINDVDSAINGMDYVLNEKDTITFISTLHGG